MARLSPSQVAASGAALLGLTAAVLAVSYILLQPSASDFLALGVFLLLSGATTLVIGWLVVALMPPSMLRTVRSQLLLLVALVAALAMVNVAFTAQLMFISPHDLALLSLLLLFSFGVSVCLAYFFTLPFN